MSAGPKIRMIERLGALWPALPFLALGVCMAWFDIAYSGGGWLSTTDTDGSNVSTLFLFSNSAMAATCIAFGAASRFSSKAGKALISPKAVVIFGSVASIGAVLIIIAGPFYITLTPLSYLNDPMFRVGCVLAGAGLAGVYMRSAASYSELPPRKVLLYISLSMIMEVFVYTCTMCSPTRMLVEGGPSIAGIVISVVLPLIAAGLSIVPSPRTPRTSGEKTDGNEISTKMPKGLAMLVAAFAVLAFAACVMRGQSLISSSPSAMLSASNTIILLRVPIAAFFIVFAVSPRFKGGDFSKVAWIIAVAMALAIVGAAVTQSSGAGWLALVNACYTSADLICWCLFGITVYQRKVFPITLFGLGRGFFSAACVAGWALGAYLLAGNAGAISNPQIFSLLAIGLLVLFILFFAVANPSRLFADPAAEGLEPSDYMMELGLSAQDASTAVHNAPFREAIKDLAESFGLTPRESEIFTLLAKGHTANSISETLCVSRNTVRTHSRSVYAKMGIHSRDELLHVVGEKVSANRKGNTAK